MYGTITFFNNQRGFGFITVPSGEQYFFHISNFVKDEGEVPTLEGRVRFDVGPAVAVGKKPQALHVQYVHNLKKSSVGPTWSVVPATEKVGGGGE